MSTKFPSANETQLKPSKEHDKKTWACDDHAELEAKLLHMDEMIQSLKKLDSKVQSCSIFVSNCLKTVKHEVNVAYNGKIKDVEYDEREEILLINKEVDEEIRIIKEKRGDEEADEEIRIRNEIRESRVKSSKAEAEKQQQSIKEMQAKFLSDIQKIDMTVREKLEELKIKKQHTIDVFDKIVDRIKQMKQDDKTFVSEAPQVIESLAKGENIHEDINACLAHIMSEVGRVKFVEGRIGGEHFARIDGFNGKWELAKSFPVPKTIGGPLMFSLISDHELGILDKCNKDFYLTNISNEQTHKVLDGDPNLFITSCARIDRNLIVCGKGERYNSGDGCITIYDRQWKMVRDITIPRYMFDDDNQVFVDVDKEGMVIAARGHQPYIYVINPSDGQIMHTIRMQGENVRCGHLAMSNSDIIVDTSSHAFTVIDRTGETKASIAGDDWLWPWCCCDKMTDTFYIAYHNEEHDIHVLHHVSCDGNILAKDIIQYEDFHGSPHNSPCILTPSGNITVCIGDKVLVYKKTFVV